MKQIYTTPWGAVQQETRVAEGIISVSTAGHGGYWLSAERAAGMWSGFQGLNTYGGRGPGGSQWFEEDCEWALVCLSYPEFFNVSDYTHALRTVRSSYPRAYAAFGRLFQVEGPCEACGMSGVLPDRCPRFGDEVICERCFPAPALTEDGKRETVTCPECGEAVLRCGAHNEGVLTCADCQEDRG